MTSTVLLLTNHDIDHGAWRGWKRRRVKGGVERRGIPARPSRVPRGAVQSRREMVTASFDRCYREYMHAIIML